MNKFQRYIILFGVILLGASCVEQFNPKLDEYESDNLIVVEGQITDEVGPFRVKLSKTFEVDNMQQYGEPVCGADVQIFDDKGNQFQLFYTVEGWYETEDKHLKGVVGNTYTLNITTTEGVQYESSPVLMLDVPEIDSLYYETTKQVDFGSELLLPQQWLDIFIDTKDITRQTKYWKWDFIETWEVRTPKDSVLFTFKPESGSDIFVYFNLEFIRGNGWENWDNKKEKCWIERPSKTILIKSTVKNPVDEVVKFHVQSFTSDDRLDIRYSILVKQTALSNEMYKYWERLKEANESIGNIYDKMPSQIFGNIQCCDGKQKVLGYFSASAVKSKRIFINPLPPAEFKSVYAYDGCLFQFNDEIPSWVQKYYLGHVVSTSNKDFESRIGNFLIGTEPWCTDCRYYGTNVKPDFWED